MPRRAAPDPPLPRSFSAATALAAGLTRDQVRQRVRSGAWVRVGTGRYVKAEFVVRPELDRYAQDRVLHAARAVAAADRHPGSAISFESAAVVHQLPMWSRLPAAVTLIVPPDAWTGRRPGLRFRYAQLPAGHVQRQPLPVTTPARTWFDVARTCALSDALCVADAGTRLGLFGVDDLRRIVNESMATRGWRRAEAALAHVDGKRESPLESASAAYFVTHALPVPEVQKSFWDGRGRLIGRVDFWWERARVVGECDGRLKYATAKDLYDEKRREDALRALGLTVVRWGAADLSLPELARRLSALVGVRPACRVTKSRSL